MNWYKLQLMQVIWLFNYLPKLWKSACFKLIFHCEFSTEGDFNIVNRLIDERLN